MPLPFYNEELLLIPLTTQTQIRFDDIIPLPRSTAYYKNNTFLIPHRTLHPFHSLWSLIFKQSRFQTLYLITITSLTNFPRIFFLDHETRYIRRYLLSKLFISSNSRSNVGRMRTAVCHFKDNFLCSAEFI